MRGALFRVYVTPMAVRRYEQEGGKVDRRCEGGLATAKGRPRRIKNEMYGHSSND
jgi:hypothetical protein